jgi:subtilisin family serine protease
MSPRPQHLLSPLPDPLANPLADPFLPPGATMMEPGAEQPTEILVTFTPEAAPAEIAAALDAVGATDATPVFVPDPGAADGLVLRVTPAEGASAASLAGLPGVAAAEPDAILTIAATSNDPTYVSGGLWGMYGDTTPVRNAFGSQAGEAWTAGATGSMKQVVGIVDTGIDYRHADLYLNVWLNQKEISSALKAVLKDVDTDGLITFRDLNSSANAAHVRDGNGNGRIDAGDLLTDTRWENGIDEDGNGYRDDLVGWDFVNNDNDPLDDNGHGTHVAGTIGAIGGNGTGVAGVAWNVQMAGLKFLAGNGSGYTSSAVMALDYFTGMARTASSGENFLATNNSWGGGGYSQALSDAVARGARADVLFVAAAGNGGGDGVGDNNDAVANWPSNLSTTAGAGYEAVIGVAALNSTGGLAGFSNYGASTVDIAAPGVGITSTLLAGTYGTYNGTSMATPHVTGALVLEAALNSGATAAQLRAALLETAAATSSVAGKVATSGRLDIGALVARDIPDGGQPPVTNPVADETAAITGLRDNVGRWKGTVANGGTTDDSTPTLTGTLSGALEAGERLAVYRDGISVGTASWTTSSAGTRWTFTEANAVADGTHGWTVRVEDVSGAVGTASASFSATIYSGPNKITGTTRSDVLRGTADADVITGIPGADAALGAGTVDRMSGGAGRDIFVLGDARGVFYDDGDAAFGGRGDYAVISDFARGTDRLQLSDDPMIYIAARTQVGSDRGLGIFVDGNANGWLDASDELIAILSGVTRLSASDLVWA